MLRSRQSHDDRRELALRLLVTLLAVVLTVTGPIWVLLTLLFVGMLRFPLYVEAIVIGMMLDLLYHPHDGSLALVSLILGGLFIVVSYGRDKLRIFGR